MRDSDSADDDDERPDLSPRRPRRGLYRWLAIGAAVIAVVVGAVDFLPQYVGSDDDPAPADEIAAAEQGGAAPEVRRELTEDEAADLAYLNTYPVWEVDKMKSPMGKSLMEAILAGDIDAVVNNDYYAVTGRATNEKAILVADLIWRAKGSPSDKGNRRIMRSAVKNGAIDLKTFSDNLAKRRPAERINDTPRPSK